VRILQISSARSLGGGERHLAALANALAGRGQEVFAALAPDSPLRQELSALPSENVFPLRLRNALDLASAMRLARHVREHQIEIVHAHMARDYPLAALAVRRNPRAKLIITRHVLFPLNKLHAVTLRRTRRVIAVSQAVEQSLLAQKIFPARKITVIPNGIDFRRYEAKSKEHDRREFLRGLKLKPESLLIGTVGEIKLQKGHEDFLRAAAIIARAQAAVHFIIAGQDTSRTGERRVALERLTSQLGLTGRVHFTGWLDDVARLLAALDVYVSASQTESFGLAIVEAMASRLPVVATATKGASEIIEPGQTGVLVDVGDYESLASAVIRLLKDQDERARLGSLARTEARRRFSLERMVTETEQVYFEALKES
jgi:glycosyltransferase involved in cell wall biosynthesis